MSFGRLRFWPGIFLLAFVCQNASAEWRTARPGWEYEFPRDHGNHEAFKTEWWYFTGNLAARDGRAFGWQVTFFRQGVQDPAADRITLSRFVTRDVKLAHFAVGDLSKETFRFFQKLSRGAYGEAGFDEGSRVAWIEDWSCERIGKNAFRIRARADGAAVDLTLRSRKEPVIHGKNGVSQKADGEGRASHYYSLTRLATEGTLEIGGESFAVRGLSWFDHEWATNQLAENQVGWDWFSLQFEDGSELMLFQIRTKDGGRDPHSSGTFVDADGAATTITNAGFSLTPEETWTSKKTKGRYPIRWKIAIPTLDLNLVVGAAMKDQELRLQPVVYWEGAVRVSGTRNGRAIKGSGFLEMTGYAGSVVGLQ